MTKDCSILWGCKILQRLFFSRESLLQMIKSTVKIDLKHMKVIKYHSNHNLSELVTEKIKIPLNLLP